MRYLLPMPLNNIKVKSFNGHEYTYLETLTLIFYGISFAYYLCKFYSDLKKGF